MKKIYILNEHGDVNIFKSEKDMIDYVEPIDVENEEYEVFDSEGLKYRLYTKSFKNDGSVKIFLSSTGKYDKGKLKNILLDFLTKIDRSFKTKRSLELDDLINKTIDLIGFTV
jgi:hypothetical protein